MLFSNLKIPLKFSVGVHIGMDINPIQNFTAGIAQPEIWIWSIVSELDQIDFESNFRVGSTWKNQIY